MMDITNGVEFDRSIKEGFVFDGFDTRENDMYLIDRSAPTPAEKEIIESVPFAHGVYDFSNILGERIFNNRTISYTFHIHEHDYDRRKHDQTVLENKLLGTHITRLEDSYDPNYYYLGKCVSVNTTDDHVYNRLVVTVDFDCYPFKISKLKEGHDIWDEFNFELDVAQPITFHPMRSTFRPLGIGDTITIGAWSGQFDGLGKIEQGLLGRSYKVGSVRSTTQGDSARAYYISELGQWLIEQDAVEAQEGAVEVNLINAGVSSVAPTIETDIDLTIVREGGDVFNLKKGTIDSDLFRLRPGENKMVISGWTKTRYEPGNVKLIWHKELI